MSNEKDLKVNLIKPFIYEDEEETEEVVEKEELIRPFTFEEEKGPEEKYYLVLYYFITEDESESKTFEFIKGRTETRNQIINDVKVGDVDIHKSRVLVEGAPLEDSLTIYAFMKLIECHFDDKFDIEEYNNDFEEYEEEETTIEDSMRENLNSAEDNKELEAANYQMLQMLGFFDNVEHNV